MTETLDELAFAVNDTLQRKHGNVIIPAFAVGRTQDILYLLGDLSRRGKISAHIKIYVDSPMAVSATEITFKHFDLLSQEAKDIMDWRNHNGDLPDINFVGDVEESIALNDIRSGAIIISASGMCDAGRIKHHLRYNLGRKECSIVITGFQAGGTLGRRLVDGAKMVRIFKQEIPVRADLYTIGGLSAHADRDALLGWLGHFKKQPPHVFVVHGEESVALEFAAQMKTRLGWDAHVPENGDTYETE